MFGLSARRPSFGTVCLLASRTSDTGCRVLLAASDQADHQVPEMFASFPAKEQVVDGPLDALRRLQIRFFQVDDIVIGDRSRTSLRDLRLPIAVHRHTSDPAFTVGRHVPESSP